MATTKIQEAGLDVTEMKMLRFELRVIQIEHDRGTRSHSDFDSWSNRKETEKGKARLVG